LKHSIHQSRFSVRILWFLFFATLSCVVASSPARAIAQAATPAAKASNSSANSPDGAISRAGATETEAEDDNVYRHTPVVQSLAKVLHLDVETTARLFEFINFAIIALAILIPLVRIMPKLLRKRSDTLKHDLESARKVTEDANTRLSAVEAKLAKLDEEIAAIRAHVEEEAKNDEVRIKAAIGEESGRIVAAAEQEIAAAAAQAKRGLRHFAADLAIEQAAKQLVLTPETDRALIAQFVSDAGRTGKTSGGQN
jgi:F-type H+-transporting ATPase subunit b